MSLTHFGANISNKLTFDPLARALIGRVRFSGINFAYKLYRNLRDSLNLAQYHLLLGKIFKILEEGGSVLQFVSSMW